ncbi:receptor activity-modifying protein 2 [Emydura macquarii macquarii]|uniref:receptor activity-modifying protein 2 n=1 Tax=Emydura macquarii macquarii TaxID=1129001 RepID=UPI00352AFCEB
MALCRGTGSGRLPLLLLWAALGSELCPTGAAAQGANESLAGLQNWTMAEFAQFYNSSLFSRMVLEHHYLELVELCWSNFTHWMMNVTRVQLCEWRIISRPYSYLQYCLESFADQLKYGYPNSIAEAYIFESHHLYFLNCTQEHPVFLDPPEDMLLALIFAPICLIPFLVTLVVWRSKDGKTQS